MPDASAPDPVDALGKMDALLKKHRGGEGGADPRSAAAAPPQRAVQAEPPDAWLPVLTQVIERGEPPPVAATVPGPDVASAGIAGGSATVTAMNDAAVNDATLNDATINDTLAEQLMSELAPRLSEIMEKQVAAELRKNLDQTVASLMAQLDINMREIVRDAVAEKLKTPRDPGNK